MTYIKNVFIMEPGTYNNCVYSKKEFNKMKLPKSCLVTFNFGDAVIGVADKIHISNNKLYANVQIDNFDNRIEHMSACAKIKGKTKERPVETMFDWSLVELSLNIEPSVKSAKFNLYKAYKQQEKRQKNEK